MTTEPKCPLCQDRGWFEQPYYSSFEPRMEMLPCPACHKLEPTPKAMLAVLALMLGLLIALLMMEAFHG